MVVKKAKVLVEYEDLVTISKKVDGIEKSSESFALKTAKALELMQEEIRLLAGNKTLAHLSPESTDADIIDQIEKDVHPIMQVVGAKRYKITLDWME